MWVVDDIFRAFFTPVIFAARIEWLCCGSSHRDQSQLKAFTANPLFFIDEKQNIVTKVRVNDIRQSRIVTE